MTAAAQVNLLVKEDPGGDGVQGGIARERRASRRLAVDCPATVFPLTGGGPIAGRLADLSVSGCRVVTSDRQVGTILVRVEVQFQLQGIAFRIVGVTAGSRSGRSFAIRFLDMPKRRLEELTEAIEEVKAIHAAKAAKAALEPANAASSVSAATPADTQTHTDLPTARLDCAVTAPAFGLAAGSGSERPEVSAATTAEAVSPAEPDAERTAGLAGEPAASAPVRPNRRSHGRHTVDTSVKLLLVNTGISMLGRILNLSQSGCRLRTDERFNVGIYVRVETEFHLHGLPFRLAGVSQAVMDKNNIGIRFLDMSTRRREQLSELIAEIQEAEASDAGAASAPAAGTE